MRKRKNNSPPQVVKKFKTDTDSIQVISNNGSVVEKTKEEGWIESFGIFSKKLREEKKKKKFRKEFINKF